MNGPKAFISYCSANEKLARRLKDDLTTAGCDAWQFNLSATPGSDSWKEILLRIEKSDFFLVLLSAEALTSRPVQEEVSHAHYCSLNDAEGQPKIIPVILADGITPPAEIIRKVRLNFRETSYNVDFESLVRSLGMEPSPFATATELDITFIRQREFDAQREAGIFATRLITNHPEVSAAFKTLHDTRNAKWDGRIAIYPAEVVAWRWKNWKAYWAPFHGRQMEYEFLVLFGFRSRASNCFWMEDKAVILITATQERKFEYVAHESVLHSDALQLKFAGFRDLASTSL